MKISKITAALLALSGTANADRFVINQPEVLNECLEKYADDAHRPLLRQLLQKPVSEMTEAERTFLGSWLWSIITNHDSSLFEKLKSNVESKSYVEELERYSTAAFDVN